MEAGKDHTLQAMVRTWCSFSVRWEPWKESSRGKSVIIELRVDVNWSNTAAGY